MTFAAPSSDNRERAKAERERRSRSRGGNTAEAARLEAAGWRAWLTALFPAYVAAGFSDRHVIHWDWVWSVTAGVRPLPMIEIFPRGGGKSTGAELAAVCVGAKRARRYVWYISETQDQADTHVQTIAGLLESAEFGSVYPQMSERMVGKYGASKGWRRNRLRTASGFIVDALGLDKAARGGKIDDQRPDMMIVDDIDSEGDSEATVQKKIATLTRKLFPAGLPHTAYLGVQNLVHPDSIFAMLADDRAEFLGDRVVNGPHPAVVGLRVEGEGKYARIIGGAPTWQGQDLDACQQFITTWGLDAFLSECQHATIAQRDRFLPSMAWWDACYDDALPPLDAYAPVVLALDAGEVSDTFAAVAVSRHPDRYDDGAVRYVRVWEPHGGAIDFQSVEDELVAFIAQHNVVQVCFDRYQLRQMTQRLTARAGVWCAEFSQSTDRLIADKFLYDAIQGRHLAQNGDATLRAHVENADRKVEARDRLRIVKRRESLKVDAAVALSMAHYRMMTEFQ